MYSYLQNNNISQLSLSTPLSAGYGLSGGRTQIKHPSNHQIEVIKIHTLRWVSHRSPTHQWCYLKHTQFSPIGKNHSHIDTHLYVCRMIVASQKQSNKKCRRIHKHAQTLTHFVLTDYLIGFDNRFAGSLSLYLPVTSQMCISVT